MRYWPIQYPKTCAYRFVHEEPAAVAHVATKTEETGARRALMLVKFEVVPLEEDEYSPRHGPRDSHVKTRFALGDRDVVLPAPTPVLLRFACTEQRVAKTTRGREVYSFAHIAANVKRGVVLAESGGAWQTI